MMSESERSPSNDSYRKRWVSTVPFAALAVLAQVGAVLAVLFSRSPADASGEAAWLAIYVLGMSAIPLLLSCLLVGYARARIALLLVLWGCLVWTVSSLPGVIEMKPKAALGLSPFLLAQAGALWLGHGTRLKEAGVSLELRRRTRWGPGFGWMLVIAGCGLFSSGSVTVLGAVELARAGGPDLLDLPGIFRLVPAVIGLSAAVFGLSRIASSRAPMAWIAGASLVLLACVVLLNGWLSTAGKFASFVMLLDVVVLVALTQPAFVAFCERQRNAGR
jgi:hypothetical protein